MPPSRNVFKVVSISHGPERPQFPANQNDQNSLQLSPNPMVEGNMQNPQETSQTQEGPEILLVRDTDHSHAPTPTTPNTPNTPNNQNSDPQSQGLQEPANSHVRMVQELGLSLNNLVQKENRIYIRPDPVPKKIEVNTGYGQQMSISTNQTTQEAPNPQMPPPPSPRATNYCNKWFDTSFCHTNRVNANLSFSLAQLQQKHKKAHDLNTVTFIYNQFQKTLNKTIHSLNTIQNNLSHDFQRDVVICSAGRPFKIASNTNDKTATPPAGDKANSDNQKPSTTVKTPIKKSKESKETDQKKNGTATKSDSDPHDKKLFTIPLNKEVSLILRPSKENSSEIPVTIADAEHNQFQLSLSQLKELDKDDFKKGTFFRLGLGDMNSSEELSIFLKKQPDSA